MTPRRLCRATAVTKAGSLRSRSRSVLGRALAIGVALGACRVAAPYAATPPRIFGTRHDLRTAIGAHDGFRVDADCQPREHGCIGVTGTRQRWYPGIDRNAGNYVGFEALRTDMLAALTGLSSVTGSGIGADCHATQLGLSIGLNDWREFDAAIDRIGARLRAEDLREPIMLCPESDAIQISIAGTRPVLGRVDDAK